MGPDNLYCSKRRKMSKSCHDLELGLTMPNIEFSELLCKNTHTETNTDAHNDSDEYSTCIVAFGKNATVIIENSVSLLEQTDIDLMVTQQLMYVRTIGVTAE